MKTQLIRLFVVAFFLSACASWKKETLGYMGAGFIAGGTVGAMQAPREDNSTMHGLLWGSLTAALVGATLIYLKDDNKKIKEQYVELSSLRSQLKQKKSILNQGDSHFLEKELPPELEGLVDPGKWFLYEIDQWKEIKKGEFVHQDKVLEVKPARIKPH